MSMVTYIIIGANIIILAISLVMIARILGADYKYRDLDEADEPLVSHGQGDYRKDIRPSDLSTDPEVIERNITLYDDFD
jgi:hypothetical protein